jgi:TolA-binding protein
MGAVFLMTAASSAIVLARKHRGSGASLSVHEQGVALASASDAPPATAAPATGASEFLDKGAAPTEPRVPGPADPRPAPTAPPPSVDDALALQRKGDLEGAIAALRALAEGGDPRAGFLQGKAEKEHDGCARARETFARLGLATGGGAIAYDARLEEGRCARQLGDDDGARRALQTLLDVPSHRERALAELAELD